MKESPSNCEKLNILYLITGLRLGGAEKQLLLMANWMQNKGHRVLVVAMEAGGILVNEFNNHHLKVQELHISGPKTAFKGYRIFNKLVKDFAPDMIHAHMIHANLFARIFKLFNSRIKIFNTAHNIKEGSHFLMKAYSITKGIPDWSTNVSKEAYNYFIKMGYFFPIKSSYLPNAIESDRFFPNENKRIRLKKELNLPIDAYIYFTAGRLEDQKNHQLLIKSFQQVQKQYPSTILVIAGEGSLEGKLKELALRLNITNSVFFLGRRADMPALMNICDCFVLSSNYEGFGLVIAEALATMKPVISTDCGGVKEIITNFGQLVPTENSTALAQAMIHEHNYPTAYQMRLEARKFIQKQYAVDAVFRQLADLYDMALCG